MNNLYKILVLAFLLFICLFLVYTANRANQTILKVCPTNAIFFKNNRAFIETILCIGCGRCVLGIPSPYGLTLFPFIKQQQTSPDTIDIRYNKISMNNQQVYKTKNDSTLSNVSNKIKATLKKFIYKVNADDCIGCTLCVDPCPVNAITMLNGKAVIDVSKCIEDDICITGNDKDFAGCPVNAISKTEKK